MTRDCGDDHFDIATSLQLCIIKALGDVAIERGYYSSGSVHHSNALARIRSRIRFYYYLVVILNTKMCVD